MIHDGHADPCNWSVGDVEGSPQQEFSSVMAAVTVPVALVPSLSTRTSHAHQSGAAAVHCSNECPTFLLLKFDDVPLKSTFSCFFLPPNFFFMF